VERGVDGAGEDRRPPPGHDGGQSGQQVAAPADLLAEEQHREDGQVDDHEHRVVDHQPAKAHDAQRGGDREARARHRGRQGDRDEQAADGGEAKNRCLPIVPPSHRLGR
jgi:hypothetical protein